MNKTRQCLKKKGQKLAKDLLKLTELQKEDTPLVFLRKDRSPHKIHSYTTQDKLYKTGKEIVHTENVGNLCSMNQKNDSAFPGREKLWHFNNFLLYVQSSELFIVD